MPLLRRAPADATGRAGTGGGRDLGEDDVAQACPPRGDRLLLHTANRQHAAGKRELACGRGRAGRRCQEPVAEGSVRWACAKGEERGWPAAVHVHWARARSLERARARARVHLHAHRARVCVCVCVESRAESKRSPVIAMSERAARPDASDSSEVTIVTPADGPSLGVAPSGTWT